MRKKKYYFFSTVRMLGRERDSKRERERKMNNNWKMKSGRDTHTQRDILFEVIYDDDDLYNVSMYE